MSEEDWDRDEYVPQTLKYPTEDSTTSNQQGDRVRGRGGTRGRYNRVGDGKLPGNSRGRNRDSGFRDKGDHSGSEGYTRGGARGRGSRGDFNRSNDRTEDRNNDDNKFIRNRGRGRSFRGNQRRDEKTKSVNGTSDNEKYGSDDESKPIEEKRRSRGMTPPRGARGRTRSSSGRFSDTPNSERNEESHPRGSYHRGRGRGRAFTSRSDGEESDEKEEARSHRGRGRGRSALDRSKSFRGISSGGRGVMRGRGMRGGRGATGRGRGAGNNGKPGEDERKPPEKYIPPEPTDDENIMFHSGITTGIHFNNYDSIGVDVTGENPPQPIHSFESAGLRKTLLDNITKSGYKKPTPVQKNSIPIISEGRDLMACAQTGSGKTAAFLIPVINDLLGWSGTLLNGSCVEPVAVILSPTRELAIQISQEARKFAHGSALKIALIYGGTVVQHQLNQIRRGCHILVAVPGRLEGFLKAGHIKFSNVKYFILDEADRMLELGFKEAVQRILSHTSMTEIGIRRTLMFSATFPQEIQELASTYLNNYLFLAVGEVGGACSDVQQLFHKVGKFDKRDKLLEILRNDSRGDELTLVFVGMKRHADFLAVYLCENDLRSTSIHGDRYQSQREQALADFKSGNRPILIATAVAARGLDIKNVSHVINYDLPSTIEEYVHRIGRTGRVGNCGKSTSFYDPNVDRPLAKNLGRVLQQANQEVPDFIISDAADNRYTESSVDEFAGTDIRTANPGQASSSTMAYEEESWD